MLTKPIPTLSFFRLLAKIRKAGRQVQNNQDKGNKPGEQMNLRGGQGKRPEISQHPGNCQGKKAKKQAEVDQVSHQLLSAADGYLDCAQVSIHQIQLILSTQQCETYQLLWAGLHVSCIRLRQTLWQSPSARKYSLL